MAAKTYLFYDLETSGLSKSFDQVLQFAAIRTDLAMNELERHQFYVQLSVDTIPSPRATITHQISLRDCASGISEREAIEKIHALMNEPGTISLGYNTLQFDDEFLRFSFYRHLLPPYTHQYANDCGRMDLYPITMMFSLFDDAVLQWKEIEGRRSLKLESINEANRFVSGPAHDAMVDVEATLVLARILSKHTKMWDYLMSYFDKAKDQQLMLKCPVACTDAQGVHYEGVMAETTMGSRANYLAPVIGLGQHQHYKNQTLWLRLDLSELQQLALLESSPELQQLIQENTWVIHKRFGEPGFLLPPLERYLEKMDSEKKALYLENKAWLLARPELFSAIARYHQHYKYPVLPNTDAASLLYSNPFPTSTEQAAYRQFLKSKPNQQLDMLERFPEPMRELALRFVGRYSPDILSGDAREEFDAYLKLIFTKDEKSSVLDFKGNPRLTVREALADIALLRTEKELDEKRLGLLLELEKYLLSRQI